MIKNKKLRSLLNIFLAIIFVVNISFLIILFSEAMCGNLNISNLTLILVNFSSIYCLFYVTKEVLDL